ncbi:16S rRNA (uracil(1498)-N(3))-methyltransferase [Sporosarcina gallistercoris]|uniref:Ribosomal RNA small subunit methyltransferase E n=1 Tax=Sporosarcina gallistercoris TaxID=2762245 RepID=A0ABR8PFC5_9BACL|nr:16S rRNA (uracil(1498)-N(3))-methyltransferase [Sporosarcina gallistercoris]MBD7906867.1 16S rRNA (uracil(1498)-N(3))-methyltransferase [Sporosarcina gallistercoris]
MQRYFLAKPFDEDGFAIITGEDEKHITRVMRMREGEEICCVSKGVGHIATIHRFDENGIIVQDTGNTFSMSELPVQVTLACGLPKGDKLELIAQKGTELGMTGMIPFQAERSIVKWDEKKGDKKTARLRKIAKEAAEQSHRTVIPEISEPLTFKGMLKQAESFDVLLFADEEEAKEGTSNRIAVRLEKVYHGQSILVLFGPEGGLSRVEAAALRDAGFLSMSLGPRILRTETAPLYVLSAVSYEFE